MTFTTNQLDHYRLSESKYEVCKIEHRWICDFLKLLKINPKPLDFGHPVTNMSENKLI